jgi:hypothetical protein
VNGDPESDFLLGLTLVTLGLAILAASVVSVVCSEHSPEVFFGVIGGGMLLVGMVHAWVTYCTVMNE